MDSKCTQSLDEPQLTGSGTVGSWDLRTHCQLRISGDRARRRLKESRLETAQDYTYSKPPPRTADSITSSCDFFQHSQSSAFRGHSISNDYHPKLS